MKGSAAKSFVTIMIVIAFSSLLLRFIVENLININIEQNESNAIGTLKLISVAFENYAREKEGVFPQEFSILNQANPPYLDKDYIALSPYKGYNYSCLRLGPSGYSCLAQPAKCQVTGRMMYSVATGGSFVLEACTKNE